MNIVGLAINLPSEEAILSVSCELLCINWNVPQAAAYVVQAAFERGLSTSYWVQTESARVSTGSE